LRADGDTKFVFDKFHVMRHVVEAMDRVRGREPRALRKRGDRRLTGSKFLWLRNQVGRHDGRRPPSRYVRCCACALAQSSAWWPRSSRRMRCDCYCSKVRPSDPLAVAGAAAFLILVAIIAALVPAQRAGRIDPATTLHAE
jgi:hypothetical protein